MNHLAHDIRIALRGLRRTPAFTDVGVGEPHEIRIGSATIFHLGQSDGPVMSQLEGIRACVFDAYGTMFDFSSALMRSPDVPADRQAALATLWRDKQLQYTWLRSLQGRYVSFWQVTGDGLDFALETLNLTDKIDRDRLMDLWRTPPAFPEVPAVLRGLRERGFLTAILSNGSREMLDAAVAGAGLAGLLDAVLSVDDVRVFKTHPNVYQHAVDTLRVPSASIAFQSSNAWDAMAASDFGMRVVWCNRSGQRCERLPGRPDHEIRTLADLPGLLPRLRPSSGSDYRPFASTRFFFGFRGGVVSERTWSRIVSSATSSGPTCR